MKEKVSQAHWQKGPESQEVTVQQLSQLWIYDAIRNTVHSILRNFETIRRDQGVEVFLPLSSYWCKKRPHCLGCFLAALHLSNHLARRFAKVVNSRVTRNRWAGSSGADSRGLTIVQTQLILKSCWNEFSSTIWLSFDKECKGASTQLLIKREHYSPGTEWHGQINVIYC